MELAPDEDDGEGSDGLPAEEEAAAGEGAAGGELINLKRWKKRNWGTKRRDGRLTR